MECAAFLLTFLNNFNSSYRKVRFAIVHLSDFENGAKFSNDVSKLLVM